MYNALTSNTIAFASSKANVKIENPASSSVQINTNVNGISAVLKNIVKLGSTRETISYSISADMRERNIKEITDFVTAEIEGALRGERILYISEFLQRLYVFIGDDNTRRQFTASRK